MNEQLQTSPRNARELRVVDWLGKRLERRLADRGGGRHEPGWEPRQNVVVGVLEPVIATPDGGTPTSGAESDALLVPEVESLPSLGLDFRARARSNAIQVFADVKLAIYLEEYPTREEQLRYEKPEAAIMAPTEEPGESPASPNKAPDAHDLPVPDTSGQLTPETDDPPRKRAARRRTTRLASVWTRVELCVPAITLEIPLTGAVVEGGNELRAAITAAIDLHFSKPSAAREFITRTRQLSADALASDAAFLRAVKEAEDSAFAPIYPQITISGFAERIDDDDYLVSVSITNATVLPERPFQDLTAYDCELRVRLAEGAELVPQRFSLAPADYRYEGLSVTRGHGRGCVALDDGDGLRSTSFPRFTQHVVTPRHDHVPPARWSELGQDPIPLLTATRDAMRQYLRGWDEFISHASPSIREVAETERLQFVDEIRRFDLGISALSLDPRLRQAFTLANRTFARLNAAKPFDSWRLFQFVYIVTNLPALAAREKNGRTDLVSELRDFADVLWFPTGGGKTEAYLGLIVTALFYDRLRGKAHGPTAWLKFPLRMLSVQQLVRVLRILVVAEDLRREATGGVGDPFTLGYMVGSSNTPNNLLNQQGWWPGIDKAGALDQEELDRHRLVAQCPYCHSNKVHLRVDAEQVRIIHGCAACSKDLPLVMSDDEVFRYMPSVVVWTVDKLSGFAWFGEFTQFVHGPKFRCPEHGWFTFPRGKKCLAGPSCRRTPRQYLKEARWHDPGPALIVQDEMHLLKEELGAFDAHYEGLLSELFRGGPSGLPPKLLGASATIEQYEDQLRQVYGRRPRSFPSPGFERSKSFYAAETADVRRVYVGVLPHYRRKADVAGIVQSELLTAVAEIQDEPSLAHDLGFNGGAESVRSLLDAYEVSLAYVNSKMHGDQIADELGRLSEALEGRGRDPVAYSVLTGQVSVPELADAIDRVEHPATERRDRLRALVGTSVVSHGVDLERLNVMVLAGFPTTIANYIQVSSRAGRTHAGIVVAVCDAFSRRERSIFTNFMSFHRFLDRMVEPVPVNKYALFGANRTLPGVSLALLWDLCRDGALEAPEEGIRKTRSLAHWWRARSKEIAPRLLERICASYRASVAGVNDESLEDDLVRRVSERWTQVELRQMQQFDKDNSAQLFRERVLSSFRQIDALVDFTALPMSGDVFLALTGQQPVDPDSSDPKDAPEGGE